MFVCVYMYVCVCVCVCVCEREADLGSPEEYRQCQFCFLHDGFVCEGVYCYLIVCMCVCVYVCACVFDSDIVMLHHYYITK
jgi:hypothetical protein